MKVGRVALGQFGTVRHPTQSSDGSVAKACAVRWSFWLSSGWPQLGALVDSLRPKDPGGEVPPSSGGCNVEADF